MKNKDFIPNIYTKPFLVLGCGNILFGDDGFGPAVIEYLEKNYNVSEDTYILDSGTGVREILFDIVLGETKPKKIIIVDAVDAGKEPGEIFELQPENMPLNKIDDFSMHQLPTSNLLRELKEMAKVDVIIIACQVKNIPSEVSVGLSGIVKDSIPKACEIVAAKTGVVKKERSKS